MHPQEADATVIAVLFQMTHMARFLAAKSPMKTNLIVRLLQVARLLADH